MDLCLITIPRPRAAPLGSGWLSNINPWLPWYNYYLINVIFCRVYVLSQILSTFGTVTSSLLITLTIYKSSKDSVASLTWYRVHAHGIDTSDMDAFTEHVCGLPLVEVQ